MSTPIDFKKLAEPFPSERISWRIGMAGKKDNGEVWAKVLAYFDARDGMDRLDQVVGPENWQDEYRKVGEATICRLGIRVDGVWVWKEDASEETDIEAVKGGMSGAFKRACVKWGIGRYLYDLKEGWAQTSANNFEGATYAKSEKAGTFYWAAPALPDWAKPENERGKAQPGIVATNKPSLKAVEDDFPKFPSPNASTPLGPEHYVVKVGKKWKGMSLKEIGPHDAESYGKYLRGQAIENNKPLTGDWLEAAEMIEAFVASRETTRGVK